MGIAQSTAESKGVLRKDVILIGCCLIVVASCFTTYSS